MTLEKRRKLTPKERIELTEESRCSALFLAGKFCKQKNILISLLNKVMLEENLSPSLVLEIKEGLISLEDSYLVVE